MAFAAGCDARCSSAATASRRSAGASASITSISPVVRVPVLSKTTMSTSLRRSKTVSSKIMILDGAHFRGSSLPRAASRVREPTAIRRGESIARGGPRPGCPCRTRSHQHRRSQRRLRPREAPRTTRVGRRGVGHRESRSEGPRRRSLSDRYYSSRPGRHEPRPRRQ